MTDVDLDRFVQAQAPVVERVEEELRAGRKRTHWMWFVFPQLRGLGSSPTAQHYGIGSLAEARAYLAHPVLGERLVRWTGLVAGLSGQTAAEIFGWPDEMKLRSCLTLFEAAGGDPVFGDCLDRFFDSQRDEKTIGLLADERDPRG